MINPWQPLFDAWLNQLSGEKKEMKPYEVKFQTTATVSVFVDAGDADQALEYAWDLLDETDATFGDWECVEVGKE